MWDTSQQKKWETTIWKCEIPQYGNVRYHNMEMWGTAQKKSEIPDFSKCEIPQSKSVRYHTTEMLLIERVCMFITAQE